MKSPRSFPLALALLIAVSWPSALCAQEWTPTSAPVADWQAVASSADGGKLVAAAWGGSVYTSANSGTTWTVTGLSSPYAFGVASLSDGGKLVAGVGGGVGSGLIYTSQSAPAPALMIAPSGSNLVFSWTVPSMNFVLQKNSDLTKTNWTDVATPPNLNS